MNPFMFTAFVYGYRYSSSRGRTVRVCLRAVHYDHGAF